MKLSDLSEARYYQHPIFAWIKETMVRRRDDVKILSRDQYEELGGIISKEYGEPQTRQDGKHWAVENDFGKFYIDLQKLMGVPEDLHYRITVHLRSASYAAPE